MAPAIQPAAVAVNIIENGFGYQLMTKSHQVSELLPSLPKGEKLLYPSPETMITSGLTIVLQNKPVQTKFQLTLPAVPAGRVQIASTATATPSFTGLATWYPIDTGLTAASREFKRGTKLLVTNLANKESVVVRINDYGPKQYTGVSLDLSRESFLAISPLTAGKIRVKYQVLP